MNTIPAAERSAQQIDEISDKVRALINDQYKCIMKEILPGLKEAGVFIHRIDELDENETDRLNKYFEVQVFPILTPWPSMRGTHSRFS